MHISDVILNQCHHLFWKSTCNDSRCAFDLGNNLLILLQLATKTAALIKRYDIILILSNS